MKNILFICKSNVGRSQMADAFLKDMTQEVSTSSAGTHVREEREGQPISLVTDLVTICMREVGLEVNENKMHQLKPEMVEQAYKVIAITPKETLPEYLQSSPKLEVWDIPDAAGTDLAFHGEVRDAVKKHVTTLVRDLSR